MMRENKTLDCTFCGSPFRVGWATEETKLRIAEEVGAFVVPVTEFACQDCFGKMVEAYDEVERLEQEEGS